MRRLKVGVIGAGKIARKHLEVLAAMPDVELLALANRGGPAAQEFARTYGVPRTFDNHRALLDSGVDAVIVAPSVLANFSISKDVLEHGLPCLLEKPPGLTLGETSTLAELAARGNVPHLVGFNRRFYSSVRQAQAAIAEKGPLVAIAVEAPERWDQALSHPADVRARWLVANASHCIDLLNHLGGDVTEVHALSRTVAGDGPNSFAALIRFSSGVTGQYTSHWAAPGGWTVTLYGVGRRVTLRPLETCNVLDAGAAERAVVPDDVDIRFKAGLFLQMKAFIEAARDGKPVAPPAADLGQAVKTMRLIESIEGRP
jgi:predicted dehydrogenase